MQALSLHTMLRITIPWAKPWLKVPRSGMSKKAAFWTNALIKPDGQWSDLPVAEDGSESICSIAYLCKTCTIFEDDRGTGLNEINLRF